jgi:hypothetical protein
MTEYTRLTRRDIKNLKPGDWVAWRKERWKPIGRDTEWAEPQLTDRPIRCYQVVFVRFGGIRTPIEKNRLHKPPTVVGIDIIQEVWDYDS